MKNNDFLLDEEIQAQEETAVEDNVVDVEPCEEISEGDADVESEKTAEDAVDTESEQTSDEMPSAESENESADAAVDLDQPSDETSQIVVPPYHERYYLRYKEGKNCSPLDIDGTKDFLQNIGFDGGELNRARLGKDRAENIRNAEKSKNNNQMFCSYCGKEIAGVEFYRLPDGRLRCTSCSSTVIKTKAEIEEIFNRIVSNLDNFFGATIDVPISIEVVDELKLKKKVGVPIGTRDDQSMLILGVAINKKKKYSIILENGAPRISLIATFAHELTHIWQYINWDNKKEFKQCPKGKRLIVYEGMAKWAEIQYLYLIGETNVAQREELITRNRQDEYGQGFCLYEERYPLSRDVMTCDDTPFTPDRYPLE